MEKNFKKHLVKHIFDWKNAKKVPSYLLKLISAMFNSFSGSVNIETLYFVQLSRVSMILTVKWMNLTLVGHWREMILDIDPDIS